MNGFDISTISGIYVGSTPYSAIYKGSTLVWSAGPPDYSTMPLTIESLEYNNTITIKSNGFSDTITMIINVPQWGDMAFFINASTTNNIITLNRGEKIQIKSGWPTTCTNSNYLTIGSSGTFKVYGNIMSVFGENNGSYTTTLPSTYQFKRLFYNSKVVDASNLILPATTLTYWGYCSMFQGCTSLVTPPRKLSATTLDMGCCDSMFYGCTSLTTAPELPATTLVDYCYQYMFYGCTSLTTAPELPATTLVNYCYRAMFSGCTSLNYIKALFTTTPSTSYTNDWVNGVASSGTFVKNPNATWNVTGNNGVPTNWISGTENQLSYLTIESLEDNNVIYWINNGTTNRTISWSTDKTNWTNVTASSSGNGTQITTLNTGDKIYFKGDNTSYGSGQEQSNHFNTTKKFNVSGNIMSLINSTSYNSLKTFSNSTSYNFEGLFMYSKVVDASSLYLPATTLANSCYEYMFRGCTSLQRAPELPATTLVNYCYQYMFYGCTSLTTAPKLPATTLAQYCYQYMFSGCTSLITAPKLPATTLEYGCYNYMFSGCSSLNYIKAMFTTRPSVLVTNNWVNGVASSGTFVKYTYATWDVTGNNGVPSGWTIQTALS